MSSYSDLSLLKASRMMLIPILYNQQLIQSIMNLEDNFIDIVDWYVDLSALKDVRFNPKPDMFTIKIRYQQENQEFTKIVRLKVPELSYDYEFLKQRNVYEKEFLIYSKILSNMSRFHDIDFALKFYLGDEEAYWLVLEDLQSSGYKVFDQRKQLDYDHAELVLENLAKFHALSIKLDKLSLIPDKTRGKSFINDNDKLQHTKMIKFYYKKGIDYFAEVLDPKLREKFADEFDNLSDRMAEILHAELNNDSVNVLNLGNFIDFNIFFKYNENNVVQKVKFNNFHAADWRNPAFDLIYFIASAVKFEVFEEHGDKLIENYSKSMNKMLTYLELDEYKLEDLHADLNKRWSFAIWVYGVSLSLTPNPTDHVDFGPYTTHQHDDDGKRKKPIAVQYSTMSDSYGNNEYRKIASKWFSYIVKKGVFDR